jgi:hydroxymethylpyrimidine/phosphomethylpyrimidine kinase
MYCALTVAGSDPSGGAGLQADLRTFTALGVYGLAVVSSLTAQNTSGVARTEEIRRDFLEAQIRTLLEDISVHAVKSGMLLSGDAVEVLSSALRKIPSVPYVMDPVIRASDGTPLFQEGVVKELVRKLIPLATLVTPNLHEAGILAGMTVETIDQMREAARIIHHLGPRYVLVKGGHLRDAACDLLFDGQSFEVFRSPRIGGKKIHGAGCVFSAAITAGLATGRDMMGAVTQAKTLITQAIQHSMRPGKGADVLSVIPVLYK